QTVLQHEDVIFIIFDVQNFHLSPCRQYAARPLHAFGQHAPQLAQHVVTIGFLNDALDAAVKTHAFRVREILGGYDHDGDVAPFGLATHILQELETVHLRHHQVEDYHIRSRFTQSLQRVASVDRLRHRPALLFKGRPYLPPSKIIVIDDKKRTAGG